MKKKNKSMYLVLMFLLLASAGFATYAIYKTSATGTSTVAYSGFAYAVKIEGGHNCYNSSNNICTNSPYGARPVITIPKSKIK